jgi:hypothetical protein
MNLSYYAFRTATSIYFWYLLVYGESNPKYIYLHPLELLSKLIIGIFSNTMPSPRIDSSVSLIASLSLNLSLAA